MEERQHKQLQKAEIDLDLLEQRSLQLLAKMKNNLEEPFELAQAEKELAEISVLLGTFESGLSSLTLTGFPILEEHELEEDIEGKVGELFEATSEELDGLTKKKADTYKSVSLSLDRMTKKRNPSSEHL
eukprot:CAMPEP_0201531334 /NCGR_PEP_ID=MMETSP0161_2-20130828/47299_1 /ASSEMBLY_ACC=CAM_ASM_000251 /TAXON_ID=180227 /ORGANISM="Neoparamoeba aestuarina, Strain SoJaBio B1-5/56/2" /LENGTH=128 /DNA_ID=CAMNT_0047934179 /DNA_START=202 /DNA_END=588 /DNA_ORIENTATION=+